MNIHFTDEFCIFRNPVAAICGALLFAAAAVNGGMKLLSGNIDIGGGTKLVVGLVAAIVVLLQILSKSTFWVDKSVGALLLVVIGLKLAVVTLSVDPHVWWAQNLIATLAYFAATVFLLIASLGKHKDIQSH